MCWSYVGVGEKLVGDSSGVLVGRSGVFVCFDNFVQFTYLKKGAGKSMLMCIL